MEKTLVEMKGTRKIYCGYGRIVCSLGTDVASVYEAIESGATRLSCMPDKTPVCKIDRASALWARWPDLTFVEKMLVEVLSDMQIKTGLQLSDSNVQLILSTTKGNISLMRVDPEQTCLWHLGDMLSDRFRCARKVRVVSCACISGVAAIVLGKRMIEQHRCDHAFVVGVDEASEFVVEGFKSFKSLSSGICRPYDAGRDGLTLGEACGGLLLTSDVRLSPYGIYVGGGAITNDANHISGPSRTGDGLHFAIEAAMKEAGLVKGDLGFVNVHGTGTVYNDEMESKALALSGLSKVPCNSLKPYIGHTLGASGVVETVLDLEQMRHGRVLGVKGFETLGTPLPLNVTACHRDAELGSCLKTASGFGGTNAAIVLIHADWERKARSGTNEGRRGVRFMKEVSFDTSDLKGKSFAEWSKEEYRKSGENDLKFFKMDAPSKLACIAACRLIGDEWTGYLRQRIGIVFSTADGSIESDMRHQSVVDQALPEGASPSVFVYTLANIPAAEVAIRHKFQGEMMVFVEEEPDGFSLAYAESLIERRFCDAVLYARCDCRTEDFHAVFKLMERQL